MQNPNSQKHQEPMRRDGANEISGYDERWALSCEQMEAQHRKYNRRSEDVCKQCNGALCSRCTGVYATAAFPGVWGAEPRNDGTQMVIKQRPCY